MALPGPEVEPVPDIHVHVAHVHVHVQCEGNEIKQVVHVMWYCAQMYMYIHM